MNFHFLKHLKNSILLLFTLLIFVSCDPNSKEYTPLQMKGDLETLLGLYEANYAPLEYKDKNVQKINWEELKLEFRNKLEKLLEARTLAIEESKKSNTPRKAYMDALYSSSRQFEVLLKELVARFQDAHNSISYTPSNLPGRVEIAFLGFSGTRVGEKFLVQNFLPTSRGYLPVKKGDYITAIYEKDSKGELVRISLRDYIEKHLTQYRNLGNAESNFTALINGIFTRTTLNYGIPKENHMYIEVESTVESGESEASTELKRIRLPWVKKDLYDFNLAQESVKEIKNSGLLSNLKVIDPTGKMKPFYMSVVDPLGRPVRLNSHFREQVKTFLNETSENQTNEELKLTFEKGFKFLNSFELKLNMSHFLFSEKPDELEKLEADEKPPTPREVLSKSRFVPENAQFIEAAKIFPAYIIEKDISSERQKAKGLKKSHKVGYLLIDTFSPFADTMDAVKEVKKTLRNFQSEGIRDIVIDTINNGGGSLGLLVLLTQALTPVNVEQPMMMFGINDSWLSDLERGALWGSTDAGKEIQRRLLDKLLAEQAEGKRISKPYSIEELMPFILEPNSELKKPFNITLLVNEMDASCADIFPAVLKANDMALIVGQRTMGAGGNVVEYTQLLGTKADVRMTESLVVNPTTIHKEGEKFVENVGVTPHIIRDVSLSADEKYKDFIEEAFRIITHPQDFKEELAKAKKQRRLVRQRLKRLQQKKTCEKWIVPIKTAG